MYTLNPTNQYHNVPSLRNFSKARSYLIDIYKWHAIYKEEIKALVTGKMIVYVESLKESPKKFLIVNK